MPEMTKPFSESCERNRLPILAVLQAELPTRGELLEIGSGTGQHATYFAPQFPDLTWICSDREENHSAIRSWLADSDAENLRGPELLDVDRKPWPVARADAVFSANTAHIMSFASACNMIRAVADILETDAPFLLYGPFNYQGKYTSDSNAQFDTWLQSRDPQSAIRDFEAVNEVATAAGLKLSQDVEMPANNRMLIWRKLAS